MSFGKWAWHTGAEVWWVRHGQRNICCKLAVTTRVDSSRYNDVILTKLNTVTTFWPAEDELTVPGILTIQEISITPGTQVQWAQWPHWDWDSLSVSVSPSLPPSLFHAPMAIATASRFQISYNLQWASNAFLSNSSLTWSLEAILDFLQDLSLSICFQSLQLL